MVGQRVQGVGKVAPGISVAKESCACSFADINRKTTTERRVAVIRPGRLEGCTVVTHEDAPPAGLSRPSRRTLCCRPTNFGRIALR
jgi:hypothetical protein